MKKLYILLIFFINYSFFAQIDNHILKIQDPANYPFYKTVTESLNDKTTFKEIYKYIDSLSFYGLSYKSSDNLRIGGYLIEPKKAGNYPVIIFNRGGNGHYGTLKFDFLAKFLGKIASAGYIVIGSQLRGSEVSEGQDEFGGKDVDDVLDLFKIIDKLPNADKSRIAVFGWSRGVMTNYLMLKKTNRIKTNITIAGQADLASTSRKEMFKVYSNRIPNYYNDTLKALKSRSSLIAIDSIKNINLTNFIIHGNKDDKVNVENAFDLYNKLNTNKYMTRLLIYENEDHGLSGVTTNLLNQITDWLKKYL